MGKKDYEKKLKAQLEEWDADINKLRAKADATQAGIRRLPSRMPESLAAMIS